MLTLLRRVFLLALLAGGGYAAWTAWQRRNEMVPAAPEWPPLEPTGATGAVTTPTATGDAAPAGTEQAAASLAGEAPSSAAGPAEDEPATAGEAVTVPDWVPPVDGTCPVSHPIKANDNSKIFHLPGGRFYNRTVPERCYATEEAAVRDGYRAAKT